jgi:EAL domain-containing protein (putative c-di-GMP-specific phosphodiesterase class I)
VTQKIAVVSPELPHTINLDNFLLPSSQTLLWFAEIEGLCAYLFHEYCDYVLIDQKLIHDKDSCINKYQKFIINLHPHIIISSINILSQTGLSINNINYIPSIENIFTKGQIQSLFQPIVNPNKNNNIIIGFECLSRVLLNNKTFTPEFLFNYAQEKLLLTEYDKLCLSKALASAPRHRDLLIFINLRPQTLISPNFLAWFCNLLTINNINFEHIIIEITEQYCLISETLMASQCAYLKERGVRIAIDDFGCGISNHSMIDIIKPDFIKISGRFLKNNNINSVKRKILKNILDLSYDCNINPVVESVEYQEDWRLASSLGAQLAQGFYFFTPLPQEELKALVTKLDRA